jgi:aspartate racemase
MQTIGLIGGMSWESSLLYYRIVNEAVKSRLGGFHSAQCLMYSLDFAEIEALQHRGHWQQAGERLAAVALALERGGADLVVLCTNTMHLVADQIQAAIDIPFLHIADPTAEAICAQGIQTIGLLGTRFTMEMDFYKARLIEHYGLRVLIPDLAEREIIHRIIYEELVLGVIRPESKTAYLQIIEHLRVAGAQGIILGCTEIGMLIESGDTDLPLFDTTTLHAIAAVEHALAL